MEESWKKYKVRLPEGNSGGFRIRHRWYSKKAERSVGNLRDTIIGRGMVAGKYTILEYKEDEPRCDRHGNTRDWWPMMSDTRAEILDHLPFILRAHGDVLVAGLGLGVVLQALVRKKNVTHVTVLEKSADVIKLVAGHYQGPKVRILHRDAFRWKPDRVFNHAWFDIWPGISAKNLPEMRRLYMRYGGHAFTMSSWCERECMVSSAQSARLDFIQSRVREALKDPRVREFLKVGASR